jgi:hypothetical protein
VIEIETGLGPICFLAMYPGEKPGFSLILNLTQQLIIPANNNKTEECPLFPLPETHMITIAVPRKSRRIYLSAFENEFCPRTFEMSLMPPCQVNIFWE